MRKGIAQKISTIFLLLILCLQTAKADLVVHFLDVGQGDAALVLCDGETMLIDGGPHTASRLIYSYLREQVERLNYVIASHPHVDHIGGIAAALNAVPVDVIYSPVLDWNSSTFDAILRYAEAQGTLMIVPDEGDVFSFGDAEVTILHCWPDAWDPNNMSIVLRIDYGETSFLFTGDAEDMSEYMMIDAMMPLNADVLKVAHHGSRYSSTQEFLDAVNPKYAIISCGEGNSYGHPHEETLERLQNQNSIILRTDELGTIIMQSDGHTIRVLTPESFNN